jgi:hypothetical protein
VSSLRQAFAEVVRRHRALSAFSTAGGSPAARESEPGAGPHVPLVDVTAEDLTGVLAEEKDSALGTSVFRVRLLLRRRAGGSGGAVGVYE